MPKNDRPVWTVRAEAQAALHARLGAGREPLISDPSVRLQNFSGLNLNVHNVAIMELTASRLGKPKLSPGDTIRISSTLLTHCEAYRMDWEGNFTLRE